MQAKNRTESLMCHLSTGNYYTGATCFAGGHALVTLETTGTPGIHPSAIWQLKGVQCPTRSRRLAQP